MAESQKRQGRQTRPDAQQVVGHSLNCTPIFAALRDKQPEPDRLSA
eukprot:CAMPEP_0204341126 /NCGR_PEP_ID=MMETSP0469-20131031/23106_1 /ASSEMBLY_ACC=CAM_ASM_000384 /TAXON_ID=2969 /ORGANISM="Oxyrrhis marina" /LENGTH=45 /DNA_ID= /DNA_START= /DNA_END= /DNA_ORIENTATION=